ncbi:TPA: single-stranded DNA-binding protein [Candidatus Poribacteria bacterium]|nr:single-stranded DNA-binding protein [Candidatus Poribacteria bacterium]HIA65287.1 single-stranded DNA-binding protein [Candidatus Poribacteria bacterium]HIC03284.1 single-stranded DNA-binding protein [Candidatus Poribacteria bacterium]HIP09983.1 single-stranded DNA-binding protein [Rhodospirillales bacterium]
MPNYNKTILMGRLTREPELKTLPSGTTNVSAGIAVNRNWTDKESGEKREEVCFIDLEVFGRNAEIIHGHFNTGSPIHVEGRLRYRTWETSDGEKRSKHDILVDSFQFVESRSDSEGQNGNSTAGTNSDNDDIPF